MHKNSRSDTERSVEMEFIYKNVHTVRIINGNICLIKVKVVIFRCLRDLGFLLHEKCEFTFLRFNNIAFHADF